MQKTTSNDVKFPVITAHEHRLRLFQATRRPKEINKRIETPWGKVRIKGRLGQGHADVFEAICFEREARADFEDGRIKILVDPYRVRKRSNNWSGSTFGRITDDLQTALIEIIEPVKFACSGHLIDHIGKAYRRDGTMVTRLNPLDGKERPLWRVEVGKAFCTLVHKDIWIGYDPAKIATLETGIGQAITRHILTHQVMPRGGWTIDGLIQAVAGDLSSWAIKHRRSELRGEAHLLKSLGIIVAGDRIHSERSSKSMEGSSKSMEGSSKSMEGSSKSMI